MQSDDQEMRVSVSISRKLNLGNYESADLFMAISNVEPGATEEEIDEALATGDLAVQVLKKHLAVHLREVRARASNLG